MPDTELLTIEEFCRKVKVSRRTVYRWIASGKLNAKRAGRLWRISASDLEAFLQEPEEKAEPAPRPVQLTADERLMRIILEGEG